MSISSAAIPTSILAETHFYQLRIFYLLVQKKMKKLWSIFLTLFDLQLNILSGRSPVYIDSNWDFECSHLIYREWLIFHMTRMDTTKFIAEVNILKSRPCLNLWSRWSPWRPCWWVPPVPGVCSFHHGRCCFSTNCSNWQSSAQSLLQIWRYYLDIYIESYLYLYVHARFQNSILLFDLAKL